MPADANTVRLYEQISGAEVPGFHARTVIDDTISKLFAIRSQIRTPVPDGLPALLDDIEELAERAIDIAYDPDAQIVEDHATTTRDLPEDVRRYAGGTLAVSGSSCIYHCSCGQPTVR